MCIRDSRSAAALNMDAVLVTPSCCDPLCRRAVRVSMGTVFPVSYTHLDVYKRQELCGIAHKLCFLFYLYSQKGTTG